MKATFEVDDDGVYHVDTNGESNSDSQMDWPEPQSLPEGLPPVAVFDFDLLPAKLRPWIGDICDLVQCAPDYPAVTCMTAIGSVIGRKVGIRPQAHSEWTEVGNQWALLIGRPGVLKSPAMEAVLAPLKVLAAKANEAYEAEMIAFKREQRLAKIKLGEAEKQARGAIKKSDHAELLHMLDVDEPEEPKLRRYMVNNTTAEALAEVHRQNPNGLLVYRDEMVSLLKSLDREDNCEARGFYLTGWNGSSAFIFDRIIRGLHLSIPAVCLSLLGSTQPGRIAEHVRQAVRGGAGDDGLIQRFGLIVWPDNNGEWREVDRWPDTKAKREAYEIFEYLDKIDPECIGAHAPFDSFGSSHGMPFLRFDPMGLGLFKEWRSELENRLRSGELHLALESHLAKYRKLVPGLALILHLANGDTGPVSERATLQALSWAEYLETHARRAYASVTMAEVTAATAIIQRIRKGDLPRTFSSRDVWRKGWAMLSDRQQVIEALELLVDLEWVSVRKVQTGGRTATIYFVNPRGFSA